MYIESGLFWTFVVLSVITISVIYTTLNNKVFQMRIKIEKLREEIVKSNNSAIKGKSEDVKALKKELASITDELSFLYLVLGVIVNDSNNATKKKVDGLIRRRNANKKRHK